MNLCAHAAGVSSRNMLFSAYKNVPTNTIAEEMGSEYPMLTSRSANPEDHQHSAMLSRCGPERMGGTSPSLSLRPHRDGFIVSAPIDSKPMAMSNARLTRPSHVWRPFSGKLNKPWCETSAVAPHVTWSAKARTPRCLCCTVHSEREAMLYKRAGYQDGYDSSKLSAMVLISQKRQFKVDS